MRECWVGIETEAARQRYLERRREVLAEVEGRLQVPLADRDTKRPKLGKALLAVREALAEAASES